MPDRRHPSVSPGRRPIKGTPRYPPYLRASVLNSRATLLSRSLLSSSGEMSERLKEHAWKLSGSGATDCCRGRPTRSIRTAWSQRCSLGSTPYRPIFLGFHPGLRHNPRHNLGCSGSLGLGGPAEVRPHACPRWSRATTARRRWRCSTRGGADQGVPAGDTAGRDDAAGGVAWQGVDDTAIDVAVDRKLHPIEPVGDRGVIRGNAYTINSKRCKHQWAAVKHGGRGTRGWKKLHFGVVGSGAVVAHVLTDGSADDATTALTLIDAVEGNILRFTADAAYDTIAIYEAAGARGATVIVQPAKTAAVSRRKPRASVRDRTILSGSSGAGGRTPGTARRPVCRRVCASDR